MRPWAISLTSAGLFPHLENKSTVLADFEGSLLLCHARISLPEGVLLCVLDDVQYQDYLLQKAGVLLFAVLRGNPDIL